MKTTDEKGSKTTSICNGDKWFIIEGKIAKFKYFIKESLFYFPSSLLLCSFAEKLAHF